MKNCLQLFVAGAMFAAGAMTANADRYYERDVFSGPVTADAIETGVQYVLNCAKAEGAGEQMFLNGTTFLFNTENITKSCLYTFQPAGKNSKGQPVYYIVNNEGLYFTLPGRSSRYSSNVDNAWKVTIKDVFAEFESDYEYELEGEDAETVTGMDAYRAEYRDLNEALDLSNASFFGDVEGGVVIASAEPDDATDICSTYTYLVGLANGATTGNVSLGTNYANNVWVIYTAAEQSAMSYLDAVIEELGMNDWDPDTVNVGNDPGCYSQDAVDALAAAFEEALAATEETAEAAAEALKAAYENLKKSFVNFGPGYYVFSTARTAIESDDSEHQGALYDASGNVSGYSNDWKDKHVAAVTCSHWVEGDGNAAKGYHSFGDFDVYDLDNDDWKATAAAPYLVWEVIATDEPGLFYIKNWKTGWYIGTPGADKKSNVAIPMVDTPNAKFNMAPSTKPEFAGYWRFYSPELTKKSAWSGSWEMGGLHASADVAHIVTWDSEAAGSLWYPRTVTLDELEEITARGEQPRLNGELKHLVEEVKEFVESTKVYSIFDLKTGKPAVDLNVFEDEIAVDGLVTDPEQISSNANQPGDGDDVPALLDGDVETFFHSAWKAEDAPSTTVEIEDPETGEISEETTLDKHYIQMDLRKACSQITVKWITRGNGNVQGRLNKTTLYASKDGENYEPVTTGEFHYTPFNADNKVTVAGEAKNCWVGVCSYDLGAEYQYVRLEHTTPVHSEARPWMNGAELRVYEGFLYEYKYDAENSPYASVPAAVVDELDKQMTTAATELEDELATEETIDALQKAFDAFKEATPNPQSLRDLITSATGIAGAAEAGEEPGYFAQEAIDALEKAIAEAEGQYKSSMTVDEVASAKSALQAALDAFQDALIKPSNGIYVITSKTSNEDSFGGRLYTQHSSTIDAVNHGFTGKNKDYAENVLGSYWKVEKVEGGFTFQNVYSGLYLAPVGKDSEAMSQSEAPYVFVLQFAQEPGCFNFVLDKKDAKNETYIYMNAQPGTGNVVTWIAAQGRDNSAWAFEAVDADALDAVISDGFFYNLEIAKAPQVATFPIDLYPDAIEQVKFYTVIGQDGNNDIQLAEATEVVAGQAYVVVPAEDVDGRLVKFFPDADDLSELKPVHELQAPVNGLVPVFNSMIVPEKCGIFVKSHEKVTYSEGSDDDKVRANSGYFNEMPFVTEKGTAFIPSAGKFADGIQNIIMNSDVEKGIYSLSGVRVNSMKNLPAGLYIINGKKYIVK